MDTRTPSISTTTAARMAGVTYRQANYWASNGLVPVAQSPGSGVYRSWTSADVLALCLVGVLMGHAFAHETIRRAVDHLDLDPDFVWVQAGEVVGSGSMMDLFDALAYAPCSVVVNVGALRAQVNNRG